LNNYSTFPVDLIHNLDKMLRFSIVTMLVENLLHLIGPFRKNKCWQNFFNSGSNCNNTASVSTCILAKNGSPLSVRSCVMYIRHDGSARNISNRHILCRTQCISTAMIPAMALLRLRKICFKHRKVHCDFHNILFYI